MTTAAVRARRASPRRWPWRGPGAVAATLLLAAAAAACGAAPPGPTAPPPTPTPTPWPTPVETAKAAVPASVDSTGSSDAAAALNAWLAAVPDGTTVEFTAGGTYRLDASIEIAGRRNLTFEGNGATLRATADGRTGSPFRLDPGNDGIVIRDFTIVGDNPNTTTVYNPDSEDQMGVLIYGSSRVEITNNKISHTWGDGVYVGANNPTHAPSEQISIHDNTFDYTGRCGVAVIAAKDVSITRNTYDHVGYHVLDVEPDLAWQTVTDVTFSDNTVGSYSLTNAYDGFFFASNGHGTTVSGITVTGNTVTGTAHEGYDGTPRGINVYVTAAQSNITVTDNTATTAANGPVLYFANVTGVTVERNTQPLTKGSLAEFSNCTGVIYP